MLPKVYQSMFTSVSAALSTSIIQGWHQNMITKKKYATESHRQVHVTWQMFLPHFDALHYQCAHALKKWNLLVLYLILSTFLHNTINFVYLHFKAILLICNYSYNNTNTQSLPGFIYRLIWSLLYFPSL